MPNANLRQRKAGHKSSAFMEKLLSRVSARVVREALGEDVPYFDAGEGAARNCALKPEPVFVGYAAIFTAWITGEVRTRVRVGAAASAAPPAQPFVLSEILILFFIIAYQAHLGYGY